MSKVNDGGPAFPIYLELETKDGETQKFVNEGMTLRDWLAGQALIGILANPNWNTMSLDMCAPSSKDGPILAATMARMYANALLVVLDK